jgi:hypothetical protein
MHPKFNQTIHDIGSNMALSVELQLNANQIKFLPLLLDKIFPPISSMAALQT